MLSAVRPAEASVPVTPAFLYHDEPVNPLPSIDITRTLAAKLCGRLDDVAFNAKIFAITQRLNHVAHVAVALSMAACGLLLLVGNKPARTVLTLVNVVAGIVFAVLTSAALSWDVLRLLVQTFEFWFLFFSIVMNGVQWCLLYHDIRIAAFTWMGVMFTLTLCIDGNIYTRHLAARFFFLAAPALFIGVALAAAHVPPDLHYRTYRLVGIEVDAVDVLVNGNLVIAYFTAMDVFRSRGLVFSNAPVDHIQCGMYYPICQLVPQPQQPQTKAESTKASSTLEPFAASRTQQLTLCESATAHGIDDKLVLWSWLTEVASRMVPARVLNAVAFTSHAVGLVWIVIGILKGPSDASDQGAFVSVFIALSFFSAIIFTLVYGAHYQRQLIVRVSRELDVWFVTFQVSVVTIGMCDLASWDWHHVLPLATMWIWCHWTVCFDAVPPVTRRRLGYSRCFGLLTSAILVVYPVALARTLYISAYYFPERDRVLVHFVFGGVVWKVKLMGFLASKLFTLQVWMIRFLWREVLRPTDAFKVMKRRVFFVIPNT